MACLPGVLWLCTSCVCTNGIKHYILNAFPSLVAGCFGPASTEESLR